MKYTGNKTKQDIQNCIPIKNVNIGYSAVE